MPEVTSGPPHWIEIIPTIALIVVGTSQVLIYFRQASIMDKQVSIAATQNDLTIESSRAYLGSKSLNLFSDEPSPNAGSLGAHFVIKNVGKHAALVAKLHVTAAAFAVTKILPDTPVYAHDLTDQDIIPPIVPDEERSIETF